MTSFRAFLVEKTETNGNGRSRAVSLSAIPPVFPRVSF